jgi:hypothetical protein
MPVIDATAAGLVEQLTGNIRIKDIAILLIFELVQTTPGATITELLPFIATHFCQRFFFPKRFFTQSLTL